MKAYLSSIIAVSIVSALVSLLVPDGKKSKKNLKFVVGIISLLAIVEPLCGLSLTIKNAEFTLPEPVTDENSEEYIDSILHKTEELLEENIKNELFERYGLSEKYAELDVVLDSSDVSDIKIAEIIIILKSYGVWQNAVAIEKYFAEKYCCEVKTAYE